MKTSDILFLIGFMGMVISIIFIIIGLDASDTVLGTQIYSVGFLLAREIEKR